MKITSLELAGIKSTREMGKSGPSDPKKAVSYHVVVFLKTDAGITGLGEMSDVNFPVTRDTVAALKGKLEPILVGQSPHDLTKVQTALRTQKWQHQVLCGIDIALHDAVAKSFGVPVYRMLGGKVRDRIPFCYPLATCKTAEDVAANLGRIERVTAMGHMAFRYYFGADLDMDERLLEQMRRRWGDAIELSALDASGWLDVETAITATNRLAPYRPVLVESPVKGRHNAPTQDFLAVKLATKVPMGEHIVDFAVATRLGGAGAVDVWNIGIGYEGITFCRKLFALAEAYGVKTLLGSTVEMQIGTAARAHTAASMPNLHLTCYPAGPLVYQESYSRQPVQYDQGHTVVPDGPGVGVEIDMEKLEKLAV
ncbi:MAG: hypothetical protein FJ319_11615 [SAR202 cluster bacterium]|nr:hypothetical protein [SAR202 cluster bacterium]